MEKKRKSHKYGNYTIHVSITDNAAVREKEIYSEGILKISFLHLFAKIADSCSTFYLRNFIKETCSDERMGEKGVNYTS